MKPAQDQDDRANQNGSQKDLHRYAPYSNQATLHRCCETCSLSGDGRDDGHTPYLRPAARGAPAINRVIQFFPDHPD